MDKLVALRRYIFEPRQVHVPELKRSKPIRDPNGESTLSLIVLIVCMFIIIMLTFGWVGAGVGFLVGYNLVMPMFGLPGLWLTIFVFWVGFSALTYAYFYSMRGMM